MGTAGALDYGGNDLDGVERGTSVATDRHGVTIGATGFDGVHGFMELGDYFNSLDAPFSIAAWVHQF